jgi:hypothetical protein
MSSSSWKWCCSAALPITGASKGLLEDLVCDFVAETLLLGISSNWPLLAYLRPWDWRRVFLEPIILECVQDMNLASLVGIILSIRDRRTGPQPTRIAIPGSAMVQVLALTRVNDTSPLKLIFTRFVIRRIEIIISLNSKY